jgi:putative nucleotidyltransferase with HDIG domain
MVHPRVASLVRGVTTLVSLPEVCIQVNELVDDERSSAADIGRVISQDPGLTARLLKIANSSFYRFPSKVETVSRAVTIIGMRELRFLVLAASAIRTFDGLSPRDVDMAAFWRHSLYTGVISRILASRCHVLHTERLFVCGLLHDVGHLVMYARIPDLVQVMHYRAKTASIPLFEAERDVFDVDHGEVGAELLRTWRLPPSLVEATEFHHSPDRADKFRLEASLVHIANAFAHLAEAGSSNLQDADAVSPIAWEISGLTRDIVDSVLQEARAQFVETLLLFLPGTITARH